MPFRLQRGLKNQSEPNNCLCESRRHQQSSGDNKSAINDYTKAIKLQPTLAIAYGNRGNSLSDLGRYQEAIQDFNQAIQISPNQLLVNRAIAKSGLGNEAEACVDLGKAASLGDQRALYSIPNSANKSFPSLVVQRLL